VRYIKLKCVPRVSAQLHYAKAVDCYINVSKITTIQPFDFEIRNNIHSSILFSCGHYCEYEETPEQILKKIREI